MGSVSDRSNPKYFLPLGLLLSCAIMFVSGTAKAIYASLALVSCCRRSTAGCRAWAGRPAARRWCTGSAPTSAASSSRSGTSRTTSAARWSRPSRLWGVTLFGDWGAKFYFNAADRRRRGRRRVLPAARHAAVGRAAAGRGVQERLPAGLRRRQRADLHVPRDLRRARAEQPLPLGDRGRERVRLLRALRRRELDSDLPADREGLLVPASRASAGRSTNDAAIPGTIACGWMSDRVFKGAARRRRFSSCR